MRARPWILVLIISNFLHSHIANSLQVAYTGFSKLGLRSSGKMSWREEGAEDVAPTQWAQARLTHHPGSPSESAKIDSLQNRAPSQRGSGSGPDAGTGDQKGPPRP